MAISARVSNISIAGLLVLRPSTAFPFAFVRWQFRGMKGRNAENIVLSPRCVSVGLLYGLSGEWWISFDAKSSVTDLAMVRAASRAHLQDLSRGWLGSWGADDNHARGADRSAMAR